MNYRIDRKSKQPAYMQLYNQLRRDITGGAYLWGKRLPSKRVLADEAGVSVITVQHACDLLIDEGYIEARERSGYYVCYREGDLIGAADTGSAAPAVDPAGGSHEQSDYAPRPEEAFPFSVLARTMRQVISQYGERVMKESPPGGLLRLRTVLAAYLARARGIRVSPDQILIGSGAEDLYGLVVKMLGHQVYAIEDPSYPKIRRIYEADGIICDPLRLGPSGILGSELARTRARVLHVTPFNSYPSRITASASKRAQYIRWAFKTDAVIIEDDYDSEFSILKKPEDTLFALEPEKTVIYINTFSGTIASSLRIGYMVLPAVRARQLKEKVDFYACSVPVFEQYVLAQLIENGDFERHINRVRRIRRRMREG